MNVLYLTMNPNRQSTTVPTEGWIRELKDRGLCPVIVSREKGDFQKWAESQGVPCYNDPMPFPNKWRPLPYLRSLLNLRRIAKRHRTMLIHCNEQNIYPVGCSLAKWMKLPVVVSVHFTMARDFCQWAFGGKRTPDKMFFLSRGSRDACQPGVDGIVPGNKTALLYNGLDMNHFKPCSERRERFRTENNLSGIVVGVACAIRPRKQIEHLVKAVKKSGNHDVKVVIAGGPIAEDKEYAMQLFSWAKEELGDQLHLLGHLDELRDFYNGIDIFVNTSQEEACSISVIESLACGCPILGYASKSVDDQIIPDGGEITPQDDIDELANNMNDWFQDASDLLERKSKARKQALAKFDISKLSEQLWNQYQSLMKSH
ncbi:glycosyltransferase family 4 protein [Rhodopirellula sp.]|nr:glycosyltransferase family 4 protein [Rhodopirellula sp.]